MTTLKSYDHGASPVKLIGETVGAFFDRIAAAHAERPALIVRHQNIRWSYAELAAKVNETAAGLLGVGLEPGDRVGIWAPNCAEWVLMQFATAKAGLILVNINPAYRTAELEYALNKVQCKALVMAPALKSSDYVEMLYELAPELLRAAPLDLHCKRLPHLRAVIVLGERVHPGMLNFFAVPGWGQRDGGRRLAEIAPKLQFDDPINIQFTSGTTGFPKGATLTHRNIVNNGFFIGEAMRLTPDDRLCIPVPLYHCFGMVLGNLACVTHGAAIVYPAEAFDPLAVLQTVQDERCTGLHGVPTMFIAELDHPQFGNFDQIGRAS
ncbi:MAG: AMP-binding protein, partial [Alphaproteobacteria bacterium]